MDSGDAQVGAAIAECMEAKGVKPASMARALLSGALQRHPKWWTEVLSILRYSGQQKGSQ